MTLVNSSAKSDPQRHWLGMATGFSPLRARGQADIFQSFTTSMSQRSVCQDLASVTSLECFKTADLCLGGPEKDREELGVVESRLEKRVGHCGAWIWDEVGVVKRSKGAGFGEKRVQSSVRVKDFFGRDHRWRSSCSSQCEDHGGCLDKCQMGRSSVALILGWPIFTISRLPDPTPNFSPAASRKPCI